MVFVLMNNRQHAIDSRSFGPVPKDHIIGKVYKIPGFYFLPGVSKPPPTGMSGDDLFNVGLYFLNLKNTTKAEEYFIKSGTEFKYVPAFNEMGGYIFKRRTTKKREFIIKTLWILSRKTRMPYRAWVTPIGILEIQRRQKNILKKP